MTSFESVLESRRLLLREMSLEDLDFVCLMLSDPLVMRFYPKIYSRVESEAWIEKNLSRYNRDGHGLWLTVEKKTKKPVGQVGLCNQLVEGAEEPEIGYLIHTPYWRQGFATEAAEATRNYAFEVFKKERVISLIRPVNLPSRGVAERIGMTPEKQVEWRGYDHIVYSREASHCPLRKSAVGYS